MPSHIFVAADVTPLLLVGPIEQRSLLFKCQLANDPDLLGLKIFLSFPFSQFKDIVPNDESESGLIKNDCLLPFKPALNAMGPVNKFFFRLFVIHLPGECVCASSVCSVSLVSNSGSQGMIHDFLSN